MIATTCCCHSTTIIDGRRIDGLRLCGDWRAEDVEAARGTGLLALEPRPQADRVEDVAARQLLAAAHHVLAADDANVVGQLQLLGRGVGVQRVHVLDGTPREYHIVQGLFKVSGRGRRG